MWFAFKQKTKIFFRRRITRAVASNLGMRSVNHYSGLTYELEN
jgi:hypothetical protein